MSSMSLEMGFGLHVTQSKTTTFCYPPVIVGGLDDQPSNAKTGVALVKAFDKILRQGQKPNCL